MFDNPAVNQMILAALSWVTTAVLAAIVGALTARLKTTRETDRAMEKGMRSLLRVQLIQLHETYVVGNAQMSYEIKDQVQQLYEAYHALGGNGSGTRYYEELMNEKIDKGVWNGII